MADRLPLPKPVAWLEQRRLSAGGYDPTPIVEWWATRNPSTSNAPRKDLYTADQMHSHAAAVSAADNAALRAEFARAATRLVVLGSQVKVLEDALRRVRNDKSFNCLKIEKTQQYVVSALEAMN